MHEKELSRKSFVKGGGALIVGFSSLGALGAGKAEAATGNTPFSQRGPQDFLPDLTQVDSWLAVTADNKVIVTHGETEMGHGTPTGILMLVAEELNTSMDQMVYAHPESWLNATGGGGGSGGISGRSTQARTAAALAKKTLLNMASTQLGVPVANLSVTAGVVSGGGKTVTYGSLIGGKMFNVHMTSADAPMGPTTGFGAAPFGAVPGQPGTIVKPVSEYSVVGRSFPRIDIPGKVMGTYTYIQNVRVPGMVHARTVRPRGAGANTVENSTPISVDASSISHIPGAQVVQINNFLAVVAPREYDAIQAAAQLKVVWETKQGFPQGSGNFWSWLRQAGDTNTQTPARYTTMGDVSPLAGAAKTISATYKYHYNSFMPIGPHCAVADVRSNSATIFCQGQSLQGIPPNLSGMLNIPAANIRVIWYEGASSFGGGQQAEAAEQAAIISQKIGKPVRVQWMRWDQHGWDHYGMGNLWDVKMGVDASGNIVAADWTTYGQQQANIDETKRALGTATWPATPGPGGIAPSDSAVYTKYANNRRVLAKTQPLYGGALKCNYLRAPNAPQQFFASEQVVDELAHAMNMDPIAFRRQNIDGTTVIGARWLAVLDGATQAAGWKPKVAASNLQSGNIVTGRGFGFGTFANSQMGIVADVQVNKKSGRIWAQHLYIAQNNGITISPQLVANQMSGAAVQGLSRALLERPSWNTERVTSLDWVSYPILRFADAPAVTLVNVHPGEYVTVNPDLAAGGLSVDVSKGNTNAFNAGWALSGSGEPPSTAVGSAVANAFFDATGV
ncbi:MAG TPA: molybdopterin cofactor-binding domain-containing protein, partial [Vicinamibacterales bacterium]|nr:molybdopterin cofactor-binding domain-containing protein [Vicinamibacterales bacterium]